MRQQSTKTPTDDIEEAEESDCACEYEPLDTEIDVVAKSCEDEYASFTSTKAIDFDAQLQNLKNKTEY